MLYLPLMKEGYPPSFYFSLNSSRPNNLSCPVSLSFPEGDLRRNMPWSGMPEMRISGPLRETIALPPIEMPWPRSRIPVQDFLEITHKGLLKQTSLHMQPRICVNPDIAPLLEKDKVVHILQTASSLDLSLTPDGLSLNNQNNPKKLFEIDHTSGQGIVRPTLGSEMLQVSQTDPELFSTAWVHKPTNTAARNVFEVPLFEFILNGRTRTVRAHYEVNYPLRVTQTILYLNLVQEMTSPKTYDGRKLHAIIDPAIIINYV